MSWLSGSISSITGQISNLTKDILTEGIEEVEDLPTELKIAKTKIKELENVVSSQKYESDRLKELNDELLLKCETSEIRMVHIHENYREILAEKEEMINDLETRLAFVDKKNRSADTLESMGKAHKKEFSRDWSEEKLTLTSSNCDFASEDQSFTDILIDESQQSVDAEEVIHFQAEKNKDEMKQLLKEKMELEQQLHALEENRQAELFAIQSSYEGKMKALSMAHEEFVQQQKDSFEHQIAELLQKLEESQRKESSNATSEGWDTCEWAEVDTGHHNLAAPSLVKSELSSKSSNDSKTHSPGTHRKTTNDHYESLQKSYDALEAEYAEFVDSHNQTVKDLQVECEKMKNHALMKLYQSLNDPDVQTMLLETFSLCYQAEDDSVTSDLLKKCQHILNCKLEEQACQCNLIDQPPGNPLLELGESISGLSDHSLPLQDLSTQLTEHADQLSHQIENYEQQMKCLLGSSSELASDDRFQEITALKNQIQSRLKALVEVGVMDRVTHVSPSPVFAESLVDLETHASSQVESTEWKQELTALQEALCNLGADLHLSEVSVSDPHRVISDLRQAVLQQKTDIRQWEQRVEELQLSSQRQAQKQSIIQTTLLSLQKAMETSDLQALQQMEDPLEELKDFTEVIGLCLGQLHQCNASEQVHHNAIAHFLEWGHALLREESHKVLDVLLEESREPNLSLEESPQTLEDFQTMFGAFLETVGRVRMLHNNVIAISTQLRQQVDDLKAELDNRNQTKHLLQTENEEKLVELQNQLNVQILSLENLLKQKEEQISLSEQALADTQKELATFQNIIDEQSDQLASLRQENEHISSCLVEKEEKLHESLTEMQHLDEQADQLLEKLSLEQEKRSETSEALNALQENYDSIKDKYDVLLEQTQEASLHLPETDSSDVSFMLSQKEAEIATLLNRLQQLEEEKLQLIEQLSETPVEASNTTQEECDQLKTNLQLEQSKNQQLQENLLQLQEDISTLRSLQQQWEEDKKCLSAELESHQATDRTPSPSQPCVGELEELLTQMDALKLERDDLITKKTTLEGELQTYQENWDQLVTSLNQKHDESQSYYSQLQELSSQCQNDISQMQTQLFQLTGELKTEQQQRQSSQQQLRDLQEQFQQLYAQTKTFCGIRAPDVNVDTLLRTLLQKQKEMEDLRNSVLTCSDNEKRLTTELARLRSHLMEMEETCTSEALAAEKREEELRKKLLSAEEASSHSANNSEQQQFEWMQKVDSLQEECETAWHRVHEQDTVIAKQSADISTLTEQLNKLQAVLITFQEERDSSIHSETEHLHREVKKCKEAIESLKKRNTDLEGQLVTQNEITDAARRLTQQIQRLETDSQYLKDTIKAKGDLIQQLQQELHQNQEVADSKIDKILMKNLLVGYFHAPTNKRADAIRVIGSLLQFTNDDFSKIGVDTSGRSGWFGWLKADPSRSSESGASSPDGSFSQLFIKFLERESCPDPMLKLPTDDIAAMASLKSRNRTSASFSSPTVVNPLLGPAPVVLKSSVFAPVSLVSTTSSSMPSTSHPKSLSSLLTSSTTPASSSAFQPH